MLIQLNKKQPHSLDPHRQPGKQSRNHVLLKTMSTKKKKLFVWPKQRKRSCQLKQHNQSPNPRMPLKHLRRSKMILRNSPRSNKTWYHQPSLSLILLPHEEITSQLMKLYHLLLQLHEKSKVFRMSGKVNIED